MNNMSFDYLQFLLSAEKNRRETEKINKLIQGLSDEQLNTLLDLTNNKPQSNICYER